MPTDEPDEYATCDPGGRHRVPVDPDRSTSCRCGRVTRHPAPIPGSGPR